MPNLPTGENTQLPERLSSSKTARKFKLNTLEFLAKAEQFGLVAKEGDAYVAIEKAQKHGIENKVFRNVPYASWSVPIINNVGATVTTEMDV